MKADQFNWRRLLLVLLLSTLTAGAGGCASTGYSVGLNYGYPYRGYGYPYRPYGYSFGYYNRYSYPYWYSTPYWRSRPYWGPYGSFYGPRFGFHFNGYRHFRH